MSNCTCGRTTRKPMCDKSCSLTEAEYIARTERLAYLWTNSKFQNTGVPPNIDTTSSDNNKA
jgi:CDGSH-type Zn-finger protein